MFGYYQDVLNSSSAAEPVTTWSFTPQIHAYGGTWKVGGPGGSGNYLMIYIDDLSEPVGSSRVHMTEIFFGFISDTPLTSVTLLGGSTNNQQSYKLDDMVYSREEECRVICGFSDHYKKGRSTERPWIPEIYHLTGN